MDSKPSNEPLKVVDKSAEQTKELLQTIKNDEKIGSKLMSKIPIKNSKVFKMNED